MNNRSIKIIKLGMSDDTKGALKHIIDQLEIHGYAISSDGSAVRFFSRFIPVSFRKNKIIRFYRDIDGGESLIRINSDYKLIKLPNYNIIIKPKFIQTNTINF